MQKSLLSSLCFEALVLPISKEVFVLFTIYINCFAISTLIDVTCFPPLVYFHFSLLCVTFFSVQEILRAKNKNWKINFHTFTSII